MRQQLADLFVEFFLAVPVRIKIAGIIVLPVLILGFTLNYWVQTGLSDWLSYLLPDERVRVAMEAGSRSVLLVTALAAVASFLLTFLMMLVLTHPLLELRRATQRVIDGDLTSRARIWAKDEIGGVARSVNLMIDQLVAGQQNLERTNRRLSAVNRVATAANRNLDLQEVLDASLKTTLDVMGLQSGYIYIWDRESNEFHLASFMGVPTDVRIELLKTSDQLCACQQGLLSGEFGPTAAVRPCRRISSETAIYNHVVIPLEARGQKFGLVNLLCSDESRFTEDDMDLLTTIGAQVSEAVANAWLHASVQEKEMARQTLLSALVRAQEDERSRLARDLHDSAGQTLTSLLVRLKALEKQTPESLRENVASLCQEVSETIEQVREISYRLRPAALEEFGLEMALRTLVQEMTEKVGLTADCQLSLGDQRLPSEVEIAIYRIAQEALTNVVRHAAASRVLVEMVMLPYAICLRIEDDGKGFDHNSAANNSGGRQRLGLLSMQERAEMIGGSMAVYSTPGQGTSIEIRVPFQTTEESL
ncbi:MAG: histidine kinase [Chloroflexota bacterium]